MADDDDWGITPNYKNVMTEKEQRYGVQAVPGRVGHIDMDELRKTVVKADEESKKNALPKASYGYGGKFGVEKDRMDKSAVGTDYHADLQKHSSQQDYAKGFGGKYGVDTDRQDKAAVGYDHHEKLSKHASQKDYSLGFGGKYGVQTDRVDSSSVGYKDANEPAGLHPSQQRAEVTGVRNRASELRARFEKLALDMNKPAERPARPYVGKIKPNIFTQPKPTEEPKLEPRPANVKSLVKQWSSVESSEGPAKPIPKSSIPQVPKVEPIEPPKAPEVPKTEPFHPPEPEVPKAETFQPPEPEPAKIEEHRPEPAPPAPTTSQEELQVEYTNVTPTNPSQITFGKVPAPPLESVKESVNSITAVATFDFQSSQSDELSFKEGDTIVDIEKFDEAWWSGRIGNRIGIFPSNRVQEVLAGAAASITAMALYDFAASQGDELSFKAGEVIVDIEKLNEMWWAGRIGNRRGIFPANFVVEETIAVNVESRTSPSTAEADKAITATALYDFAGSKLDELSFKAGDEIVDIDKFDALWWSGRIGDRRGIFPSNYVFEN